MSIPYEQTHYEMQTYVVDYRFLVIEKYPS